MEMNHCIYTDSAAGFFLPIVMLCEKITLYKIKKKHGNILICSYGHFNRNIHQSGEKNHFHFAAYIHFSSLAFQTILTPWQ